MMRLGLCSVLTRSFYLMATNISRRRWTRATRSLERIVLYTKTDASCHKLVDIGRTSTVASTVNNSTYRKLSNRFIFN